MSAATGGLHAAAFSLVMGYSGGLPRRVPSESPPRTICTTAAKCCAGAASFVEDPADVATDTAETSMDAHWAPGNVLVLAGHHACLRLRWPAPDKTTPRPAAVASSSAPLQCSSLPLVVTPLADRT